MNLDVDNGYPVASLFSTMDKEEKEENKKKKRGEGKRRGR